MVSKCAAKAVAFTDPAAKSKKVRRRIPNLFPFNPSKFKNCRNPPDGINLTAAEVASASRRSNPTMTSSTATASATVRPIGPIVSCLGEIGITPARLVSPTVGLMPTTEFFAAGQRIDPSVSMPSETVTILAATAIADPLLDPHGPSFSA
ncbi:hypothetical protein M5K25_021960 [Dendrobium thyrsiflorum]|uniref:Uncharacterized protein n=1 Tax=Dendrobium thyrsiflorum TaxID=117978 RepID=A0ABD0U5A6_DENTH